MKTSGTTSSSKWQPMTTSDNEWQWVTRNDNEWQRMTASNKRMKTNESKYNRVILSFKIKQKAALVPEEFYSMFCAIYFQYNMLRIHHESIFSFFSLLLLLKLLKHVKLIVKCKLLFENVI